MYVYTDLDEGNISFFSREVNYFSPVRERFDITMETTSDEYDHPVKPTSKRTMNRKQRTERLSEDAGLADDLFRAKYDKFSIKATHKYKPVNWPSDDNGLIYEYNCWHLGNEVQKFIPIFLLTSWVTAILDTN